MNNASRLTRERISTLLIAMLLVCGGFRVSDAQTTTATDVEKEKVIVVDGIVQPRRPVADAIAAAMAFLKKGDGGYRPGSLDGARAIAETLVATQGKDGSWPFRVIAQDGQVYQQFGGAPVFYVRFFEEMNRHEPKPKYQRAHDLALKLMIQRNVEGNHLGTFHEDIRNKPPTHLSSEPMCFTVCCLFRHGKEHPEFIGMGRRVLKAVEGRGWPSAMGWPSRCGHPGVKLGFFVS